MPEQLRTYVVVTTGSTMKFCKEQIELRAEAYRRRATDAMAASDLLTHDVLKMGAERLQQLANMLVPVNEKVNPDLHAVFMRHAAKHIEK